MTNLQVTLVTAEASTTPTTPTTPSSSTINLCGASWEDAKSQCIKCPGGLESECPGDSGCYAGLPDCTGACCLRLCCPQVLPDCFHSSPYLLLIVPWFTSLRNRPRRPQKCCYFPVLQYLFRLQQASQKGFSNGVLNSSTMCACMGAAG